MEYEEDEALTQYVWNHYGRLFSEFETRVARAITGRLKAAWAERPERQARMLRDWAAIGVPEIEAALAGGIEAFRRKVRDRLLRERADDVFVNRCPRCFRVVRTPHARQCFWCGWDWHDPDDQQELGAVL